MQVHPTEPPVFLPVKYHETQASHLRRKHVQNSKERGQYELRSVKEERARAAAKQELQKRAKAHVAKEQAEARRRILQDLQTGNTGTNQGNRERDAESFEGDGDSVSGEGNGNSAKAEVDASIDRLSEAHRQSRHNKIEADVTHMTRELLATAGLDVLRFVEGPQHPTQSAKQVLASIVDSVPRNRAQVRSSALHTHLAHWIVPCLGQRYDGLYMCRLPSSLHAMMMPCSSSACGRSAKSGMQQETRGRAL